MLSLILLLISTPFAFSQTTVGREVDDLRYNCPARSTIEEAYWDYCNAFTTSGFGMLTGVNALVTYNGDPPTYFTAAGDFELTCGYTTSASTSITCRYLAGGGQSLTLADEQNTDCPTDISTVVPRPSTGVDYRRRALRGRATAGRVPTFTCPFASDDDNTVFISDVDISAGQFAVENGLSSGSGFEVTDTQVFYTCGISRDVGCYYIEDDSGVQLVGSFPSTETERCPLTLCSVGGGTTTPPPTRRGVYLEGAHARVSRNQVDPRKLRRGSVFGRR